MKTNLTIVRNTVFIVLTGILMISCEKDDDEGRENDLIGTWTYGTSTFNTMVGDKALLQYLTDDMAMTPADAQLYASLFTFTLQQSYTGTLTFNSNNTYTANLGGQADSGTWSLSANGNELTIDSSTDDPMVLTIDRLTANELKVHWTETGSEDLNDDTIPETIRVDVNLTFTK